MDIAPACRLVDDVSRGVDTSTVLQALIDACPGSVLHVAQATDDLHVLRVVVHIHLRTESEQQSITSLL